jgi:hypothetical protein
MSIELQPTKASAVVLISLLSLALGTCLISAGTKSVVADNEGNASSFELVNVTLQVKDADGTPISNAQVKAFSEDWGFRIPNFGFNETDENGTITLPLLTGNWSFYAWGSWDYINTKSGQGYFVALNYVNVSSNAVLTLQPDTSIIASFHGLGGEPLQGDVRVLDSDHTPIVHSSITGRSNQSGKIEIWVKSGIANDILFSSQNSTVGYGILQKGVTSGSTIDVQVANENPAHIVFDVSDKNYSSGNAVFFVNYNDFDIGENTGLAPITLQVSGRLDFYTTPTTVTTVPWIEYDPWCYSFVPYDYNLSAAETYAFNLGGPLTMKLWVQEEQTQLWIDIRDSFGNPLCWFWNDGAPTMIPITLTNDTGTIYEGTINGSCTCLDRTFDPADSPDYKIDLSMGPYGNYSLLGTLLSNSTLLQFRTIHTDHLDIEVPDVGGQIGERFESMANLFEKMYEVESSELGEQLSERTVVRFQIDIIAGVAGSNWVGMAIGFSVSSTYITVPSTFVGVASHELGHVFQLSPPHLSYYVTPWFGEPGATLFGNLAIKNMFGDRVAFYDRGSHDYFYYYLRTGVLSDKLIENIQFVLYYIKGEFGLLPFIKFNNLWGNDTAIRDLLYFNSFNLNETIVTLLSFAANTNLGWLFKSAGLDITEQRIDDGLNLIRTSNPSRNLGGLEWHSLGGIWIQDGSELKQIDNGTVAWILAGNTSWSDYEVEVDVKLLGGNKEASVGFRVADSSNMYYFCLAGYANLLTIAKIINNSETYNIQTKAWSDPQFDHWYHIKIEVYGNVIHTYLDGVLIFNYVASDLPSSGGIGLRTFFTEASFSNLNTIIIPEFPSFLVLPLFMIATLLAVIAYRRKQLTTGRR